MTEKSDLQLPADFPRAIHRTGAVSGAAPKILLIRDGDKFLEPGTSDSERYERWVVCEDLARQLAEAAKASKAGKRTHMNEVEILAQYLPRLVKKAWASEAECRWTIRRAAALLCWPAPSSAMDA